MISAGRGAGRPVGPACSGCPPPTADPARQATRPSFASNPGPA